MTGTCRHYEVVSPEMVSYGWMEPPEPYRCWAMVEADNARAAIVAAVKLDEFKDWVREARSDNVPPFKGLVAKRPTCEHGNCWGCAECARCLAEWTPESA